MITCRCGHARDAHQHLRLGTDCAYENQCGCRRYRRRWWPRRAKAPGGAK